MTRGVAFSPVESFNVHAGSRANAAIGAGPRRRPANGAGGGYPTLAPLDSDRANPLGCHDHTVCPSRGPIGYCDVSSLEPTTAPGLVRHGSVLRDLPLSNTVLGGIGQRWGGRRRSGRQADETALWWTNRCEDPHHGEDGHRNEERCEAP